MGATDRQASLAIATPGHESARQRRTGDTTAEKSWKVLGCYVQAGHGRATGWSKLTMRPVADDAAIYRKHAHELTRYATMLVGPDDAADVVATAVLSCMSSRRWSTVTNPRAYLYRATFNEATRLTRTVLRRRQAEAHVLDVAIDLRDAPPVEPDVAVALRRLSVRQRSTIYLTYWEDLHPHEVAALLGISEGAVRRHLARARTKLREVLHDGE